MYRHSGSASVPPRCTSMRSLENAHVTGLTSVPMMESFLKNCTRSVKSSAPVLRSSDPPPRMEKSPP